MGQLAADVEQLKARNVALETQLATNNSVRSLKNIPALFSSSDDAPCLVVRSFNDHEGKAHHGTGHPCADGYRGMFCRLWRGSAGGPKP